MLPLNPFEAFVYCDWSDLDCPPTVLTGRSKENLTNPSSALNRGGAGYGIKFYLLSIVLKNRAASSTRYGAAPGSPSSRWSGRCFLESMSVAKIAGLVAILIGVVLLNLAGKAN